MKQKIRGNFILSCKAIEERNRHLTRLKTQQHPHAVFHSLWLTTRWKMWVGLKENFIFFISVILLWIPSKSLYSLLRVFAPCWLCSPTSEEALPLLALLINLRERGLASLRRGLPETSKMLYLEFSSQKGLWSILEKRKFAYFWA